MTSIGVLSVHLDGAPCAVACPFCYLGARLEAPPATAPLITLGRGHGARARAAKQGHSVDQLEQVIDGLEFAELAIAVSEPVDDAAIARLCAAAARRGRPATLTTTIEVAAAHPQLLQHAQRLNLSVDAWKIAGDAETILRAVRGAAAAARAAKADLEIIALATLATPTFASLLVQEGLLAALVDVPELSGVALSALKPPPPFCDRAFWLRTLAALSPLLDRALDRRLFLDCYVAARLLGLGACPGRADLSPGTTGIAFRSCVYAARPDYVIDGSPKPAYEAPSVCPFDTRL